MIKVSDKILDFLQFQSPYRFRLKPELVPSILEEPFLKAVKRFEDKNELEKIEHRKMGICEEVADVTYQVLKLICLRENILTEKTSRILHDYLEQNGYYDKDGALIGLDYIGLDNLSLKLVPEKMILDLQKLLPDVMFVPGPEGDHGYTIIKDFIAGQLVAHISRVWTKRHMRGIQAIEHIRDNKIPDETRELLEVLIKIHEGLAGDDLMRSLYTDLECALRLIKCVDVVRCGVPTVRSYSPTGELFKELFVLLKTKIDKPVFIENALWLMFLKMKGRQELTFSGFTENDMKLVAKPVEYLIEADLVF